jgi:hypothetical protein
VLTRTVRAGVATPELTADDSQIMAAFRALQKESA